MTARQTDRQTDRQTKPEVSVIIPVFDSEKTLNRCVDSVLSQSLKSYEIILVDDGSQDQSGRICDEYSQKNKEITVIHKKNAGVSSARNLGMASARGMYVMFLDSDDYITVDCLETLTRQKADLVIGTIVRDYGNNVLAYQAEREDQLVLRNNFASILPSLLDESRLNYPHAKLYSRRVLAKYNLRFEDYSITYSEDTVFTFTFLKHCESIFICNHIVHHYFPSQNGLGRRFKKDRYVKNKILSTFLEETCKEMGLYNEPMKQVINKRRVQSAAWNVESYLLNTDLANKERIQLLDEIKNDYNVASIYNMYDVEGKDNLVFLMEKGSRQLLRQHKRQVYLQEIRIIVSNKTPKLLRRFKKTL